METRHRIRRRRSSSPHGTHRSRRSSRGLAILATTCLMGVILISAPMVLGATPLWFELPLLDVIALLIAIQGLRLARTPGEGARRGIDAIDLAVLVFVLYAVARWLTSPAEYFSRIEVMGVFAYAGVFLTCRYGIDNRKYGIALLYTLVVLGLVEAFLGYYINENPGWYPFGALPTVSGSGVSRWQGTYESPNHYVSLLVMSIGVTLALGSFSKLPWPARIVFFYLAIMMIAAVIYTGSRGGWIALFATIGALMIKGIRIGTQRWWVPVIAAVVLIGITLFLFTLAPVVSQSFNRTPNPLAGGKLENEPRVTIAAEALNMARDHLVFGTGPATFPFVHPHYQQSHLDFVPEAAHDDYLNCLDDYGLVGFAVVMFFVAAVTLKYFQPLDLDNRWQDRTLVAAGFATWLALMIHSLFDYNFRVPANALVFFTLTGLALGRFKPEKRPHWSHVSLLPLGRWLGWGVLVLSAGFAFLVTRTALSDWALEQATSRADEIPLSDDIAAADESLRYDPGDTRALAFLGDNHRELATLQKSDADRLSEAQQALDAYQKAFRQNPLDDSLEFRMGQTLDIMQKYPEALTYYLAAVAAQSHNGLYWYALSIHYLKSGELEASKAARAQMGRCFHRSSWYGDWEKMRHELFDSPNNAAPTAAPSAAAPAPAAKL